MRLLEFRNQKSEVSLPASGGKLTQNPKSNKIPNSKII
jgi:hypothetical protein